MVGPARTRRGLFAKETDMKLNLKDINYKQFFLEKGERIGLWVAGPIMGLLILVGILKALSGDSSQATVSQITGLRDQAQGELTQSGPSPDVAVLPQDLLKTRNLAALDAQTFAFPRQPFTPAQIEDFRWRQPKVLAPDEFDGALVRAQVPSYWFSNDFKTLYVRVAEDTGKTAQPPDNALQNYLKKRFGKGKGLGGPGAAFPGGGGSGGMRPPPTGPAPGAFSSSSPDAGSAGGEGISGSCPWTSISSTRPVAIRQSK